MHQPNAEYIDRASVSAARGMGVANFLRKITPLARKTIFQLTLIGEPSNSLIKRARVRRTASAVVGSYDERAKQTWKG
jgi:hypothetical protein